MEAALCGRLSSKPIQPAHPTSSPSAIPSLLAAIWKLRWLTAKWMTALQY